MSQPQPNDTILPRSGAVLKIFIVDKDIVLARDPADKLGTHLYARKDLFPYGPNTWRLRRNIDPR
jgi:hypothetical protein